MSVRHQGALKRICADRAIAQQTFNGRPGRFHGVHCKATPQTRGAFTLLVILMETREGGTPHIQFSSPAIHHPPSFLSFSAKDVLVSANNDFYRLYFSGCSFGSAVYCFMFHTLKSAMYPVSLDACLQTKWQYQQ